MKMKKYFTSLLAVLLVLTIFAGASSAAPADGTYTIGFTAKMESNDNVSQMDARFAKPATLDVVDNNVFATLSLKDGETPLNNLMVRNSAGEFVPVQVINETTYKFEVHNMNESVLQITVVTPQGTMTPVFRIVYDHNDTTLPTPAPEETKPAEPVVEEPVQPIKETEPKQETTKSGLAAGKHQIQVKALRFDNDNPSMIDQSLLNPAIWEVTADKIYAYVTTAEPLTNVRAETSSGSFKSVEVINETTYKFEIWNKNNPSVLKIDVPASGMNDIKFRLVFDLNTLEKLEDGAEPVQVAKPAPSQTTVPSTGAPSADTTAEKVANPKTGDTTSLFGLMILFAMLTAVTFTYRVRKSY